MHPQLPVINGVAASTLQLPVGNWPTVLDGLCDHFAEISRGVWLDRIARGRVLGPCGMPIVVSTPYRAGHSIHYYREVSSEVRVPFTQTILHEDEHLVVADKPHFLPVIPGGRYVEETLLARLIRQTGNRELVPLHRIDRATAGLVLFSARLGTRALYQDLFRRQQIAKLYEALAPALPEVEFPLTRKSRLVRGEPFFRMRETEGEPNSETRIDVSSRNDCTIWRYSLQPVGGLKHQLRVHMATLGAAIANDCFYPDLGVEPGGSLADDDYDRPLKLIARSLVFIDPIDGCERHFTSRMEM